MHLDTLVVHAGRAVDPSTGAVAQPIYLSTVLVQIVDMYVKLRPQSGTRCSEADRTASCCSRKLHVHVDYLHQNRQKPPPASRVWCALVRRERSVKAKGSPPAPLCSAYRGAARRRLSTLDRSKIL
jgi:hypothetical protein